MTNFKKGETVYRLKTWDNKGTFSIEKCVIDSAGKQRIHLEGSKGEMRKHREYTEYVNKDIAGTFLFNASFTNKSDIELKALELADMYTVKNIAHLQINIKNDNVYSAEACRKRIQEFHKPEFLWI